MKKYNKLHIVLVRFDKKIKSRIIILSIIRVDDMKAAKNLDGRTIEKLHKFSEDVFFYFQLLRTAHLLLEDCFLQM